MLTLRHLISIVGLLLWLPSVFAQEVAYVVTQGVVRDSETRERLPLVEVRDTLLQVSTVTNQDGEFILKTAQPPSALTFSHVGYTSQTLDARALREGKQRIYLAKQAIDLPEVTVLLLDPLRLIQDAIERIPANYPSSPELLKGFYRETTQRRGKFIYVAEALTDVYKNGYGRYSHRDAVAITKARRIISTHAKDTLGAKMRGGPSLATQLDLVKNFEDLLASDMLQHYQLRMAVPTSIAGRNQYVVEMTPYANLDQAFYYAKIYIDARTLAFTRFELSLDMRDRNKATNFMLHRKPFGVRFRPKAMTLIAAYGTDQGVTRLRYVRSHSSFQCDWKRRLFFHSNYDVVSEMAITGRYPASEVHPIPRHDAFPSTSSLYDKVQFFSDPDFWGSENIIAPSDDLESGIDRLIKKLK